MNPVIRRRLPPSVRSLLTDISPKQEWADTEQDTVTKDGILLPSRGAAPGQEDFLSPAKTQEESSAECGVRRNAVCMLCRCKPSCYTCPRCNLQYCGLACYRSPDHAVCSEEFYKESVLQELKNMGKTEEEERRRMQEVLVGLRQKAERTDGGMETLLKEAGVLAEDEEESGRVVTEKVQAMELLSRLAELQQSEEGDETEIETILGKLEELNSGDLLPGIADEEAESSEGELDLTDHLTELDIDKLSEEELWGLLSSKEREKFMGLMKDGAFGGLVPLWEPWWEEHKSGGKALVEVLQEEANKLEGKHAAAEDSYDTNVAHNKTASNMKKSKGEKKKETSRSKGSSSVPSIPPISAKIPKLSSLCANPSPLVCYSLVNALHVYAFTLCLYNNDTDSLMFEFCDMILALSEALNSNKVFNSFCEAIESGEALILGGGYLDKEDPLAPERAVEAVAHILTGRDREDASGYCLAALSQLRSVFSKARSALSKEGEDGAKRQKYFLASKKCEFFQAWVLDNEHRTRSLAIESWSEYSRRQSTRVSMEKEKITVELKMKEERSKRNRGLIQELS